MLQATEIATSIMTVGALLPHAVSEETETSKQSPNLP